MRHGFIIAVEDNGDITGQTFEIEANYRIERHSCAVYLAADLTEDEILSALRNLADRIELGDLLPTLHQDALDDYASRPVPNADTPPPTIKNLQDIDGQADMDAADGVRMTLNGGQPSAPKYDCRFCETRHGIHLTFDNIEAEGTRTTARITAECHHCGAIGTWWGWAWDDDHEPGVAMGVSNTPISLADLTDDA